MIRCILDIEKVSDFVQFECVHPHLAQFFDALRGSGPSPTPHQKPHPDYFESQGLRAPLLKITREHQQGCTSRMISVRAHVTFPLPSTSPIYSCPILLTKALSFLRLLYSFIQHTSSCAPLLPISICDISLFHSLSTTTIV